MPALIIKHKVTDFATWLRAYEAHGPTRQAAGITGSVVCQSADDPNDVTVYFEVEDLDRARQFTQSADLAEKMQAAGVASAPEFQFLASTRSYSS